MKIAILGPQGTFSHEAALNLDPEAEIDFQRTIRDVMEVVEAGRADCGLVPLENSVSGSVGETLDSLTERELRDFLDDKLSPIERPKLIEFRDELPKTMIGKLSKKELVAEETAKNGNGAGDK